MSLLPRARALGRGRVADEEVEAELGGRFIPDDVRAYLRSAGTDRSALLWPVCSALACVTVGLVGALPFVARLTLAAGALGFVWIAARVLPAQRRLADQRVRFLKHGVVVVPDVRTTAEATRFSYEYSVDGTKHVHTMVKPTPQPLWSPYQLIYDPAQPTEPRNVRDLYPDLVVEADAVRMRDR